MTITNETKKTIFHRLALAFVVAGILSFIFEYRLFADSSVGIRRAIIRAIGLILIGIALYLIQKIKKESLRETLTIILLVSNIPFITFNFLERTSITMWVFPIIIIIASLIFNSRTLLISTALVAVISQSMMWILKPQGLVTINGFDYITRIGILIIAFLIGLYVNRIYIAKIKENEYRIKFQQIDSDVSSDFININEENMDEKINKLLAKLGQFFQVDRTYLFLVDHDKETMTYSYEWCNEGIKEEVGTIEEIPLSVFPWWIEQLETKGLVYIRDTREMGSEALAEKEQLERQEVKSLISVPVAGSDNMQAFIGIDSVLSLKVWESENIELLNILSNILSTGLTKLKSEKDIEFMAYYDNLTGLANRFLFKDRLEKAISLARAQDKFIAMIFIDLDNFKTVNDTMGHSGGDQLLVEVSKALSNKLGKADTAARFGGDEFMIMIKDIEDKKDIPRLADSIMAVFEEAFIIYGQEFFITASAGVAVYPLDGEDEEDLIKNADMAMYDAKAKGKNGYAFCTYEMKDKLKKDMKISRDLYKALEREELELYYQPQIDLTNKRITGLEALVRWNHPDFGMILPDEFIPLAEKNSLIGKIGKWVLQEACSQNKRWQDMGFEPLYMGVNLSSVEFVNPNLAKEVEEILKETGLDPKYLEIEITESIAIKETDFVIDVLNKLKKVGVSIAIDDFGTEYSSLSRLKQLPIDRIKIDMEFVHGIESNEKDKSITMIIIDLAKSLGVNVLAEGVETLPQLDFLNQKMCDYVQGFYYYKPMPAHEVEKILISIEKEKIDGR